MFLTHRSTFVSRYDLLPTSISTVRALYESNVGYQHESKRPHAHFCGFDRHRQQHKEDKDITAAPKIKRKELEKMCENIIIVLTFCSHFSSWFAKRIRLGLELDFCIAPQNSDEKSIETIETVVFRLKNVSYMKPKQNFPLVLLSASAMFYYPWHMNV